MVIADQFECVQCLLVDSGEDGLEVVAEDALPLGHFGAILHYLGNVFELFVVLSRRTPRSDQRVLGRRLQVLVLPVTVVQQRNVSESGFGGHVVDVLEVGRVDARGQRYRSVLVANQTLRDSKDKWSVTDSCL